MACRAQPIGHMRGWEPVWSGLACQRGHVLASTSTGQLLELQSPEAIRSLADVLEPRGAREHGLQAALRGVAEQKRRSASVDPPVRLACTRPACLGAATSAK